MEKIQRIRGPPTPPKKLKSPVDDPKILEEWHVLFKRYTEVEGMRKWKALERIAREYGGKSASNVRDYLEPNVRRNQNALKKIYPKPDRETEDYRLRNSTRMYLYRHIGDYVGQAFENNENPLTIDDLTFRLAEILAKQGKSGVLLRNKTLLDLIGKYEREHGQQLLQQVPGYEPPAYLSVVS